MHIGNYRSLKSTSIFLSLLMISAACSTQSSVRGGDAAARIPTDGGKTPTNNKSGSVKPDLDEESAESSLPQEISGAFLTCSYVTAKESGFPESTERVPVGCVVERGESQFEDSLYDLDMKLYSPSKNVEEIDIRPSISNTKWQRFAHLPRAGKTKHSFGMVLTDKRSGESYGPLLFPVTKLTSSSDEVTLNLVGSYVPNAVHSIETQDNPLNQKNIDTPILPAAICSDGMIRESVDMNQYKDIVAVGGAIIGKVIQGIANKDIVPSEKIEVNSKPTRAVRCFGIAKEAGPNSYSETIRTQPVLEGGGCFILQSEQGVVVYDQKTINKYNIKREFLETYVLKNQCSPSQQRK